MDAEQLSHILLQLESLNKAAEESGTKIQTLEHAQATLKANLDASIQGQQQTTVELDAVSAKLEKLTTRLDGMQEYLMGMLNTPFSRNDELTDSALVSSQKPSVL